MSQGLARDDIRSLLERKTGQSIVCAAVTSKNPVTIRDNSGVFEMANYAETASLSAGDVCLFLFDCLPSHPLLKRVTVVPSSVIPIYLHQLERYRERNRASQTAGGADAPFFTQVVSEASDTPFNRNSRD